MAAKKAIRILRDFFREQEDGECVPNDEFVIEQIIKEPNPGVEEARRHGLSITVTEGDTIYKIGADNSKQKIGKVSKDIRLTERRFSVR